MLSKETIHDTLQTLHEGIVVLDAAYQVVFWNEWMSEHSGTPASEALGRRLHDIFPTPETNRLLEAIEQALEKGQGSVVSQSLCQVQPLPLSRHQDNPSDPEGIQQFITIHPLRKTDAGTHCLLQISDVSWIWKTAGLPDKGAEACSSAASERCLREISAHAIIETIHEAIVALDRNSKITSMNRSAKEMLALEGGRATGQEADTLFTDYETHRAALLAGQEVELKGCRRSTELFDVAVAVSCIGNESDGRQVLIARDITKQKQAEESLHREKEFTQITLNAIHEAVITTDEKGRVNSANQAACDLLRREQEEMLDRPLLDLLTFTELEHRRTARQGINNALTYGKSCASDGLPELRFANQESIFVNGRIDPLRAKNGSIVGSVAVLEDITNETRMREILSYQATHDDLTSLINRREFERRLENALTNRVGDAHHILLYFDLDQFKLINDNCGHNAGDQMLRQLTSILAIRLRHTDTLARLGGDEFAALLPHCGVEVGRRIADELRELVREFRFNWGGRTFGVGVSIGLVELDDTMHGIVDALTAADSA